MQGSLEVTVRPSVRSLLPFVPVLLLIFFAITRALYYPLHDFGNYYFGSSFLIKGLFSDNVYDPLIFNRMLEQHGYSNLWLGFSPNPPFITILFIPFTLLPPEHAKLLFNTLSVLLFFTGWFRLSRHFNLRDTQTALLPLLFVIPLLNNMLFGQVYLVLFFLLSEAFLSIQKNRHKTAGFLLALAILMKITPLLLVVFLVLRKNRRTTAWLIAFSAALFSLSLLINGPEVWMFFIRDILPRAGEGDTTAAAFTINYQSMLMLLKYAFVADAVDNPAPLLSMPVLVPLLLITLKLVVLYLGSATTLTDNDSLRVWSIWILLTFILSPYGSTYSCILILFPLLSLRDKSYFVPLAIATAILVNFPVSFLYDAPLLLQFPRLLLTLFLFFILTRGALQRSLHWYPWLVAVPLALLPALPQLKKELDESTYLTAQAVNPLLVDYYLKDGFLFYRYWHSNQLLSASTGVPANTLSKDCVSIQDNQIWFQGTKLTMSSDNKKDVCVINDFLIVYMSDKGRGYKFYTLRKLFIPRYAPAISPGQKYEP